MTELISLLALSICLALLAAFLLICYSDYRRDETGKPAAHLCAGRPV